MSIKYIKLVSNYNLIVLYTKINSAIEQISNCPKNVTTDKCRQLQISRNCYETLVTVGGQ